MSEVDKVKEFFDMLSEISGVKEIFEAQESLKPNRSLEEVEKEMQDLRKEMCQPKLKVMNEEI